MKYTEATYRAVRQANGLEATDTSMDKKIDGASEQKIMEDALTGLGVFPADNEDEILSVIYNIASVEFGE